MLEEAEVFGTPYRPDLRKMLDTNFRELLTREVRRILCPRTKANSPYLRDLSMTGSQRGPCVGLQPDRRSSTPIKPDQPPSDYVREVLRRAYAAFNARDIEVVL